MAALGQMPNFGLEACLTASGWLLPFSTCELDVCSNADSGHLEPSALGKRAGGRQIIRQNL